MIRQELSKINHFRSTRDPIELNGEITTVARDHQVTIEDEEFVDNIIAGNFSKPKNDPITDEVLKSLINLSTDIISILSPDGTIMYESDSIEIILGYGKEELLGQNAFSFVHKEDYSKVLEDFTKGLTAPGKAVITSFRFRRKDGSYAYLEATGTKFADEGKNNLVIISRDISSRIESENNIQRLTAAVEQSSNTIVITNIEGEIEYVNRKFADLTGYSKDEVIGKSPSVLKSGLTTDEMYKDMWTTILTGNVWQGEFKNRKKCGEIYWERIKITPVVDKYDRITNFIAIKDDISNEKLINEKLEQNLREKEIMLKEIHHRVKNNLQIVISLLNLQSTTVDDVKLKNQLSISQNRVRSMALIHQHLYRSEDLSKINMEEYLLSLSSQLLVSYEGLKDAIKISVDAADICFTIETAVPFGLLINELVSNSLKHGFPGGRKGRIKISLKETEKDIFELDYFDDGVGIKMNIVNGHVVSFGMHLIEMLVSQLEGSVELIPSKGTNYKINFRGSSYQTRFQYS